MTKWIESQIETRAKLDASSLERAYAELAASVSPKKAAPQVEIDDVEQADSAAKACLKHIGLEPGAVPDDVKDAEERLASYQRLAAE